MKTLVLKESNDRRNDLEIAWLPKASSETIRNVVISRESPIPSRDIARLRIRTQKRFSLIKFVDERHEN